jgi:NurA-like 5'-3' nuclease
VKVIYILDVHVASLLSQKKELGLNAIELFKKKLMIFIENIFKNLKQQNLYEKVLDQTW